MVSFIVVDHSMGMINQINAVFLTYLTYLGYSLRRNSVEVLKDIMVYSISSLKKNEVNIKILQGQKFSLIPNCILTLTVIEHV